MSEINEKVKGRISIYAAGGAGTNIATRFEKFRGKSSAGLALVDPVYIDTSKSNILNAAIAEEAIYHFEGLDGAGQVRREHAATVKERAKEILHTHKPGNLAIALHSASGGSGSVIAPILVQELLARDIPVIVIMVGDASTRLYAENTLATIKSYEAIAKAAGSPIVIAYLQNTQDTPRPAVDEEIESIVVGLSALFSRENAELDTRDLYNWLRFDKVTTFKTPMLAGLHIVRNGESHDHVGNVISVATLAKTGADASLAFMPEVRFLGLLPADMPKDIADKSPVHYITGDRTVYEAVTNVQKVLKHLGEEQQSRVGHKGVLDAGDRADETGLIF
jgi:hypothetical protein